MLQPYFKEYSNALNTPRNPLSDKTSMIRLLDHLTLKARIRWVELNLLRPPVANRRPY